MVKRTLGVLVLAAALAGCGSSGGSDPVEAPAARTIEVDGRIVVPADYVETTTTANACTAGEPFVDIYDGADLTVLVDDEAVGESTVLGGIAHSAASPDRPGACFFRFGGDEPVELPLAETYEFTVGDQSWTRSLEEIAGNTYTVELEAG